MSELDEYYINENYILYNCQPSTNTIKQEIKQLKKLSSYNAISDGTSLDDLSASDKEKIYSIISKNNDYSKIYLVFGMENSFVLYQINSSATSLSDSANITKLLDISQTIFEDYVNTNWSSDTEATLGASLYLLGDYKLINSNICFTKDTDILCDQGEINILNIDLNRHTINKQKIIGITKTLGVDDKLVLIRKNSIKYNIPNKDILITRNHKIVHPKDETFLSNKVIKAGDLVRYYHDVKVIKYNNEVLYNIMLKNYSVLTISNLKVESLNPSNKIYKMFLKSKYNEIASK